jgi:hypothetical protein
MSKRRAAYLLDPSAGSECRGKTAAVCERFKSDSEGPNSGGLKAIQKGGSECRRPRLSV